MTSSARIVDDGYGWASAETYDVESGQVWHRGSFGYAGRGPIPLATTILIRTKNEDRLLASTLDQVAAQLGGSRDGGAVQVLVVDSGSTDRTLRIAEEHGADIIQLPRGAFTYGYALNVGIAAATGEIVVSLSAHAVPADQLWLANLVVPFAVDAQLAGCFGRESPWPDATVSDQVIATMRQTNVDWPRYVLHDAMSKFSNTNGAVRRAIAWEIPFNEAVPSGEDTMWASAALQRGWRVLYTPDARVWHSHDSNPSELVRLSAQSLSTHAMTAAGGIGTTRGGQGRTQRL